ncbi:hypothetical protein BDY19DRAFT_995673 [Irpex rosettiformis]|uniref:Uncharacterized protein n=1 Tax=Irpex rosettiformis TaxID=378272 RepID=A0ACB8TXG7_9APHY|nr:hypothetical protein BDY19DRAFT_995673 [Irpex rosettiformis]
MPFAVTVIFFLQYGLLSVLASPISLRSDTPRRNLLDPLNFESGIRNAFSGPPSDLHDWSGSFSPGFRDGR